MSLKPKKPTLREQLAALRTELEDERMRHLDERLRLNTLVDEWKTHAARIGAMYERLDNHVAGIRQALAAPNPCDLVEWATKVKDAAGEMSLVSR